MWRPTVDDVLRMHQKVVERTGGANGVRNQALIESAIARFDASYGGQDAYTTPEKKTAALMCGLIQNHGFVDGNKRIGVVVMCLVLRKNGFGIRYAQPELVDIALRVATGKADIQEVATWIHCKSE